MSILAPSPGPRATSTLSRAVGRLDAAMGVCLLHRTTHRVTEEGAELHWRAADIEQCGASRGRRLRVTAPTDVAQTFLVDLVGDFCQAHP